MFGAQLGKDNTDNNYRLKLKAFISRYERLIGAMSKDSANLLFATDTAVGGFGWGSPPGLPGYWEMQSWVRAGVPLKTLFEALTISNARAFGLDDEIGTIEVRKRADLLLLSGNPLEDVAAYNTIETVILGGEKIKRESLSARE
jgi:imidazolonepropionase-like amidohydrolase